MKHDPSLERIENLIRNDFESKKMILSFDEYLEQMGTHPKTQLRGSAQMILDMMDYFGSEASQRFKVFDQAFDEGERKVVGQTSPQVQIYKSLRTFTRVGTNNRMILLHGPNGSAKSSIARALMRGLEVYAEKDEGALYTFNWIFPLEKLQKGSLGLANQYSGTKKSLTSFAKLAEDEVQSKLPCDLKDHPFLLIPRSQRKPFLSELLGPKWVEEEWAQLPQYLKTGDLCPRCRMIADALLTGYAGDYKKVLMHIQVERLLLSSRYRKGLVTIEPQMHVDAQYSQLTMNKNISLLPPSLHGLNLFSLSGDLIDGNRGLVDFSDLLKRPIDSFKYLLFACETGMVGVGPTLAQLDTVMIGSANEIQLDAFKDFPDFMSFRGRFELIKVPYLLSVSEEEQIYTSEVQPLAGLKHVAPHSAWVAAYWAVLTRLKKPNAVQYPPTLGQVIARLTPVEKAKLYDSGEPPSHWTAEERKVMRAEMQSLKDEYQSIPYYEGRLGASAREMKSILSTAAQNSQFPCLSPLAIFTELESFCKRITEHEFLRQDVKDGYHDSAEFIRQVTEEYLNRIDREVRESMGLYDSKQWQEFLKKYIQQTSHLLKKEKVKNPMSGALEDPDLALIDEFEKIVGAPEDASAKETFRQNIISTIGAWALDHPQEPVVYSKVFPEFWAKLEKHYFESQKGRLTEMHQALLVYDSETPIQENASPSATGSQLAENTVRKMVERYAYCPKCAKEVIGFLLKQRY